MQNFRTLGAPPQDPRSPAAGGFTPKPLASGGWGLRPQTPIGLRRLGNPPPDPQNSPPLRFLATRQSVILVENPLSGDLVVRL